MKNLKILIILLFIGNISFSQTTIYNEDFSGQLNKGAYYNNTTGLTEIDLSEVNWTMDISATTFDSNADKFRVIGNTRFIEARDLDGEAIWYSPSINISAFTDVQFSLDAFESSPTTNNLEDADTLITEYRLDGGAWIQAGNNGFIQNDFANTTISHNILLNGTTLELRILINNNGDGERMRFDNVLVEGTAPVTPTITINPNTNTVSGLSVVENNVSLNHETFIVQGSSLTNDIVLAATPLSNFVISTNANGPYTDTITLTQTGGNVDPTTIYTQLAFGLAVNSYTENIIVSSTGATSETVVASGTVSAHTPATSCDELFISEIHEAAPGTADEQYIEIYNPTNSPIDLSNYQIARFVNGRVNYSPVLRTIPASEGTIEPYSTFLIARNNSILCNNGEADYCTSSGVMNFDGNDVIALQNSNAINIDVLGVLNITSNYVSNQVLSRNPNIQEPTVVFNAADWISTPSNDTSMLGWHINECLCSSTTTWETTGWDNGIPDASTSVVINAPYNTITDGNIIACSLTVNAGASLTVSDLSYIDVETNIVVYGDGNINVQKNGTVVQHNPNARAVIIDSANGEISVTKETAPINNWYEYTYWSSPVQGEQIQDVFAQTNADRRYWFNANNYEDSTMETANDNTAVTGQDDVDDNGDDWQLAAPTDVLLPGVGYAATLSPAQFVIAGVGYAHVFEGPFNNGDINVPVVRNDAELNDTNWNFIGNPYPSAIDVDTFLAENTISTGILDGALYLWSQSTTPSENNNGNSGQNFDTSDYATINGTGEIAGGDNNNDGVIDATDIPNRFIPSGQGFFVSFSDSFATTSGNVLFNNGMRVTNSNDQFFKNASTTSTSNSDKIWINFSSDNGVKSQILVGYLDGATSSNDGSYYDATRNASTGMAAFIYSNVLGSDKKFSIQGKATNDLDLNEEIPLGIFTSIDIPTIYSISICKLEGNFMENNTIYIEDTLLNTVHNLSNTNYTFTSDVGDFSDRFKIIFNPNTLSTLEFDSNESDLTIIEIENNNVKFSINSNDLTISKVEILDVLGRSIYQLEGNTSSETYNLSNLSNSVYIAKVQLNNGKIISKKAIKK